MRIALAQGFQDDAAHLPADRRAVLLDVILSIPAAFREPHRHSGLDLRKLHPSEVWELERFGASQRSAGNLEAAEDSIQRAADMRERLVPESE